MRRERTSEKGSGAFGNAALELRSWGLQPLPIIDKRPSVRNFQTWPLLSKTTVARMAVIFADADLGILCGQSGIVVVDADDRSEALTDEVMRLFGDTPLKIRTPRGRHFVYRAQGHERPRNLRKMGLEADVKAGCGSFVQTAPTRTDRGAYEIEEGSWADHRRLPVFNAAALGALAGDSGRKVRAGSRNNECFRACLRLAHEACSLEQLEAFAEQWVVDCADGDDFTPTEAINCARSAWRIQSEGRNALGGRRKVWIECEVLDFFRCHEDGADAAFLWLDLQQNFGHTGKPFAISCSALSKAERIRGWGRKRYQHARDRLIALGEILLVKRGKRAARLGYYEPDLYAFAYKRNHATLGARWEGLGSF